MSNSPPIMVSMLVEQLSQTQEKVKELEQRISQLEGITNGLKTNVLKLSEKHTTNK